MDTHIVELVNVTRDTAWLPWAVQYFFLIGLSVGSFLLSLRHYVFARGDVRLARLALLAALVCGLSAPVALLSDLHQPGRFYHFYLFFTPNSWMSWGAFFIPAYVTGLLIYAWLALRPDFAARAAAGGRLAALWRLLAYGGFESLGARRLAAGITTVAALLVALYTGMEVEVVRARALWHTPFLPPQFLLTALAGAVGLVLVFNRSFTGYSAETEARLNQLLLWLQCAVIALGLGWFALASSGLDATHARALAEVADSPRWQLTAVWAALAAVAPVALIVWRPVGCGWITGLIALHSAWMIRWTVFIGGQDIPKTGAGFYDYHLPLGHDGLLGLLGTAGLWLFLLIVIASFVVPPRHDRAAH